MYNTYDLISKPETPDYQNNQAPVNNKWMQYASPAEDFF
jgi:hypothetical protein